MAHRSGAMFVGADVSERRGLDVIALDECRSIIGPPRARVAPNGLEALLLELQPDAVAIDSPPEWSRDGASRQGERELAALGVSCFRTPSDPQRCAHPFYNWMRVGHAAFSAAARAGYRLYRGGPVTGCALEVFPHSTAVALAGARPPPGTARRVGTKAAWRRSVLESAGVDTSVLQTLDHLDAALAALTALLAWQGGCFTLGDPDEGLMVLPGPRPPGRYPREV
jgi:predicted nuclease with RNAse H fold